MITYFYIVKGPLKGFRFKVKHGLTLGRDESNVNLKDLSVSKHHAIVGKAPNKGPFFIRDQNSGLGTYRNGVKVKQASLKNGDKIRVGKTVLLVKEVKEKKKAPRPAPKIETSPDQWQDIIKEKYRIISQKVEEKPIELTAMEPIIKLTFTHGLQLETEWIIGYGPRIVGSASLDLRIIDEKAKAHCFELIPTEKGTLFQTDHPEEVQVNNKELKSKILETDDIISFLNTQIKVSLMQ